jgi:hypothetical protein
MSQAAKAKVKAAEREVQYVVRPGGQRTAVVVPLALWEALLADARRVEDLEDTAIARDWLARRRAAQSPADMGAVPWEAVEAEWDLAPADTPTQR